MQKLNAWPKHATLASLCLESVCLGTLLSLTFQPGNERARSNLQSVRDLTLKVRERLGAQSYFHGHSQLHGLQGALKH